MVVKADGPPMPADMPAELKTEFDAIRAEVEKLPKDTNGHPDFKQFPDALKARMEKLRSDYEAQTGKELPKPPHPPSR